MADFVYPSNSALQTVAQTLLPRLTEQRPVFRENMFPIVNTDDYILQWEQADNYTGLQQVRGLNGDPTRVKPLGARRFLMEPGVYGEFSLIDERQLTTRRPFGVWSGAIDIGDLVLERQNQLLSRRLDRIEAIVWTLLITGTFAVADGASVLHTDSYTTQTFSAAVDGNGAWTTFATSTPIADLREVQLKSRGYSVDFGGGSEMWMNRITWNNLMSNTNAADLGGRKTNFGASLTAEDYTRILTAEDLPTPVIYDQGYLNDAGTFVPFIADNKIALMGRRRDGDPIGEYRMVRNVNNDGMAPGAYMKTIDRTDRVPRSIEVHDGHNGGPVIFHPAAIVILTVG